MFELDDDIFTRRDIDKLVELIELEQELDTLRELFDDELEMEDSNDRDWDEDD